MYRNEYKTVLEQLKSALEYQQDYANWQRCVQNILQYDQVLFTI